MKSVSIIIHIHNQINIINEYLSELVRITRQNQSIGECIIIDDGSTDGTTDVIKNHDFPANYKIIYNPQGLGYLNSIKSGIANSTGHFICLIDGDYSYQPEDIPKLIAHLAGFDIVIGSREYFKHLFPISQRITEDAIGSLLSKLYDQEIPDVNSGMAIIKRDILQKYIPMISEASSFTTSLTLILLLEQYAIKYVPVCYTKHSTRREPKIFSYIYQAIKSYSRIYHWHRQKQSQEERLTLSQ